MGRPVVPDVYWICTGAEARRPAAREPVAAGVRPEAENAAQPSNEDDVAQLGQVAADLAERRRQVVAAMLAGEEEPLRARLTQHVGELLGAVRRIDRHQHEPRERGAELEEDPLRPVGRPHRDVIARRETGRSARAAASDSAKSSV